MISTSEELNGYLRIACYLVVHHDLASTATTAADPTGATDP